MPALKPGHVFVTDEEDVAITAAALSDPDNPPLTDEDLAGFRPAKEVFAPELMTRLTDKNVPPVIRLVTDTEHAARTEAIRKRGRPPLDTPKKRIALRVDEDVLAWYRAQGAGWQTRMNAVLRAFRQAST